MKYLLFLALFLVVIWALRRAQVSRGKKAVSTPCSPAERMVQCAHCGVNQPVSESLQINGRYFCCRAHWQEAELPGD